MRSGAAGTTTYTSGHNAAGLAAGSVIVTTGRGARRGTAHSLPHRHLAGCSDLARPAGGRRGQGTHSLPLPRSAAHGRGESPGNLGAAHPGYGAAQSPAAAGGATMVSSAPLGSADAGREQQADTARRKRSALARPPGSGQRAGAAQGLWGSSTTGRGQHHLDRSLGVSLPAGMDSYRLGARPGPDPVADHLAIQQQRCRRGALVDGPRRPGRAAAGWSPPDRRQAKHGAKVEGKAGAAGMVAAGGVDQQDLGRAAGRAACSSSGPSRRASRFGR
jgi:hypothetical protein